MGRVVGVDASAVPRSLTDADEKCGGDLETLNFRRGPSRQQSRQWRSAVRHALRFAHQDRQDDSCSQDDYTIRLPFVTDN